MSRAEIMSWDWREQPDLDKLGRVITEMSSTGTVYLAQVDSGSDQYAIVLSDAPLSKADVAEAYRRHWEGKP